MTPEDIPLTVRALAYGYTRGSGFDVEGAPMHPDLEAVIATAAARLAANPEQVTKTVTVGPFNESRGAGFQGWSLAELAVLNRYRKRAQ
ncbi:hypothetical protein MX572_05960 [Rhodococcus pyridinivorans]|uniref:hypothetical protein n=1 Tax=Rhodococcus TaxID=1827 RepID=UPI0020C70302|nr:hypothetical protein [Rhodococcus pyridinivorans]UTM38325.1 hypothetical protein MX572_05960 [Rhodococcus pyridinivorans]